MLVLYTWKTEAQRISSVHDLIAIKEKKENENPGNLTLEFIFYKKILITEIE